MKRKIKILVVDDSAFMRLLISDILSEDADLEVIGTASDGQEGVERAVELKPDVVVMDMNMGQYDGIYAIRRIMEEHPLPILVLSAVGNTNLQPIFDALRYGAVDYMNKPDRSSAKMRNINYELVQKIKSVSRAAPKVITSGEVVKAPEKPVHKTRHSSKYQVLVIGASTGGPSAVEAIVCSLPGDLPVPVIIAQHMPANFIHPFVKRLDGNSELEVIVGAESLVPRAGTAIVCAGHTNTILKREGKTGPVRLAYTEQTFSEYNHPSINALMLSAADVYGSKALGVILTGMGKDGAQGLKAIHDKGGFTVGQGKESSIIYGMPKVAKEIGGVSKVLELKEIGSFLVGKI